MLTSRLFSTLVIFATLAFIGASAQEPVKPKFNIKVADYQTTVVDIEDSGVIDPMKRIKFNEKDTGNNGFFMNIRTIQNQTLHLSHFPTFMINGKSIQAGNGGRFESINVKLPKAASGRERIGSSSVLLLENLRITQTLELHPSKAKGPGQKRLLNNVLITHTIENKGAQPANVGMRIYMDTYVITNDGCLFASPVTHPG